MKRLTLLLFFLANTFGLRAQVTTAVNFIAEDCNGNEINLFNELDSGKIVVLNWTMPCVGCIGPTETSYDVAESYAALYPNKVRYFLIDDFGDTDCATLSDWVTDNNLGNKI